MSVRSACWITVAACMGAFGTGAQAFGAGPVAINIAVPPIKADPSPAPAPASANTSVAGVGASVPVRAGVVVDIQSVSVDSKPASDTAQVVGGVLGGLAGVWLAKDSNWGTQAVAGTAGAALGSQAAKVLSKTSDKIQRVTLKLDDGGFLTADQPADAPQLLMGQRVLVVGQEPSIQLRPAP